MVNTETVALPEVGQLVRVRDRHWVVTNVVGSALPPDVLGQADAYPCHLVELSSVEDDAFGDDLTVFWEVEPGVLILPKATLPRPEPNGFDDPARLGAFLDAVRWGAIASADVRALQSPFRSGISIEDYQLDPVVRALQMPRVNLLIADDVGLGKTIEAGLVVQELLLRHRAHTVFIVCPASLTLKWQTEMHDRFGLEFRIVDSNGVKQLRRDRGVGANIWTHFPRLIVSIDWLKRPRAMALLDEILPHDRSRRTRRFDLLIVDEVHQCAPPGRGAYAVDSLRTIALETIAPHFEHRLFLSATPHNGYPESFTALLAMLDPQRFQRRVEPNEEAKARVLVRRMKSELRKELPTRPDGSPRFPDRQLLPLEVTYPDSERRVHALLKQYTDSRKTSVRSGTAATATDFVTLLLKKRLFSSPKAFLETLREHMKTLSRRGATRDISDRQLRAEFDRLDEDVETDDAQKEATRDALAAAARVLPPLASNEQKWLAEMLEWADREQHRPDAKAQVLLNWLDAVCRPHGEWNNERVIVFTEYRDTQVWLHDLLSRHGFTAGRVALLYGGMDVEKRERVKAEFQAQPDRSEIRILLATDAASEGIDLQLQCHRLVHMEIPFSPTRLEQRNGRIDRHGQEAPVVEIRHFVGAGYRDAAPGSLEADLDFLSRIAQKTEAIRDDLGTAGRVLAEQVEEAMLGRRTAIDEGKVQAAASTASRRMLRIERNLREEIHKLRAQLDESIAELGISPAAVERVVTTALELARQPKLRPLSSRPGCFRVGAMSHTWALTKMGLADPLSGEERAITFDHEIAAHDRDVVLAHLGHRLVTHATGLLRAEIWKSGGDRTLHRVSACVVPDTATPDVVVLAHARLVVTGRDGHRLHEEIIVAGGRVRGGRFARLGVTETRQAIAAQTTAAAPSPVCRTLASEWPAIEDGVYRALDVRGEEVTSSLERKLRERAETDARTMTTVLNELRTSIQDQITELEGESGKQLRLQLESDEQRGQLERDIAALRHRLKQIPEEIERESEAIAKRYESPTSRVFPAAVTFVVPERLAEAAR